jgi:hypothetical protein
MGVPQPTPGRGRNNTYTRWVVDTYHRSYPFHDCKFNLIDSSYLPDVNNILLKLIRFSLSADKTNPDPPPSHAPITTRWGPQPTPGRGRNTQKTIKSGSLWHPGLRRFSLSLSHTHAHMYTRVTFTHPHLSHTRSRTRACHPYPSYIIIFFH